MEQIQQLLEILKETPQMALWGLGLFFTFTLLKLASWIFALKVVFQQAIKRFFDYKEITLSVENKKLDLEKEKSNINNIKYKLDHDIKILDANKEYADIVKLSKLFKKSKISTVNFDYLRNLLEVIKSTNYIHEDDIKSAIQLIKKHK